MYVDLSNLSSPIYFQHEPVSESTYQYGVECVRVCVFVWMWVGVRACSCSCQHDVFAVAILIAISVILCIRVNLSTFPILCHMPVLFFLLWLLYVPKTNLLSFSTILHCLIFLFAIYWNTYQLCFILLQFIYTLKRISLGNLGIYNATKAYKRLWRMTQNKPKWLMQRITQICVLWYTMIYCMMSLYGSSPQYRLESHESNIQAEQHVHIDII